MPACASPLRRQPLLLFLLLLLPLLSPCSKLSLQSPGQTPLRHAPTEIPLQHDHPFSCELVFCNVYQNVLVVNVSEVQAEGEVDLVVYTEGDGEQRVWFRGRRPVDNGTVGYHMDLSEQAEGDNFETIMGFNLSYTGPGSEPVQEYRQAYLLFCQNGSDYVVRLPQYTLMITQAAGLVLTLLLPWNIQYRKFLPFTFNLLTCALYILALLVAFYFQFLFGFNNTAYQFQRFLIGVLQLVCLVAYAQDLLMLCLEKNSAAFALGLGFGVAVMGADYFLPLVADAWFLNNVIAVMVAGAFIKFVIIRKFKSAVWALGLMWVFCLLREFAKQFRLEKFDQGLGLRVVPLFFQLPKSFLDPSSTLTCSAFGSTKIIAFGVILNYCKRVDLYLSTHFYRILACLLTLLCLSAELGFNLFMDQLPTVQAMSILLFYPLATALILFFANKRGEWAEIWSGSFYDMAVNRASIRREVRFEDLESDFGRDLLINGGSGVGEDIK